VVVSGAAAEAIATPIKAHPPDGIGRRPIFMLAARAIEIGNSSARMSHRKI